MLPTWTWCAVSNCLTPAWCYESWGQSTICWSSVKLQSHCRSWLHCNSLCTRGRCCISVICVISIQLSTPFHHIIKTTNSITSHSAISLSLQSHWIFSLKYFTTSYLNDHSGVFCCNCKVLSQSALPVQQGMINFCVKVIGLLPHNIDILNRFDFCPLGSNKLFYSGSNTVLCMFLGIWEMQYSNNNWQWLWENVDMKESFVATRLLKMLACLFSLYCTDPLVHMGSFVFVFLLQKQTCFVPLIVHGIQAKFCWSRTVLLWNYFWEEHINLWKRLLLSSVKPPHTLSVLGKVMG